MPHTSLQDPSIESLTQAQRDRLAFIELRLRFMGSIRRQDLVTRFGMQEAAATRDIGLYKTLAANNIQYDAKAKTYLIGNHFSPLFSYDTERVLAWLTQGIGDNAEPQPKTWIISDGPALLAKPDLNTLSAVTRAMYLDCPLSMQYHSLSSGLTQCEIVPFALIDTGLRWHVRAFDRKSQEFRDFVLTRIQQPKVLVGQPIAAHEQCDQDAEWNRTVELELVPHPDQPHPEITEMDYGMQNGVLRLTLRAATVGYTLRKWDVDCSAGHQLYEVQHRLWLVNSHNLNGIANARLAPGIDMQTIQKKH
ncbi:putative DNA-binding transcriptional regulator YafY [Microvirgula sp. AG722]|uniref:WYL domain-containing protein n=1 Tax=Microvirgula sp. AG722 TaxID=2183901 RepID=UPI000DC5C95D|nr:WYL domain-containing protein [Microvirgula sp. AG722]RAS11702.1 putative DNA-binding transcriptional regulator YafY [Microvirgula sp. AG722]